jgi:2-polyprenyl-3-methyl-5-hydroxy-6-metoxy-1,4-benzoquinol methylase
MFPYFFPDMRKRSAEKELMDIPGCDENKLINTVRQFQLLNMLFTSSRRLIRKYIISDIIKRKPVSITFLDIGSGGCDLDFWFLKECKKLGVRARITCLDSDKKIIDYAKNKYGKYPELEIVQGNAFDIDKLEKFDYIFANHFIHHIDSEYIPEILKKINSQSIHGFLLNDIKRSNLSYFGYSLFTGLFFHNSFAFYDGSLSIKKGFLADEIQKYIEFSKLSGNVNFKKHIPSRIYLFRV